jgi:hypothetical protein
MPGGADDGLPDRMLGRGRQGRGDPEDLLRGRPPADDVRQEGSPLRHGSCLVEEYGRNARTRFQDVAATESRKV